MIDKQTEFIFFSGKGGVGKTSMASTTAVHYAEKGLDTIIVTTDPAANLSDVFEQEIGHQVTAIAGIENLFAMEIDSKKATEEYKEQALAPMKDVFNDEMLEVVEEQLNSPCTEEMASFDKFVDYTEKDDYQIIVFDTAPTGHTLRLLELPMNWEQQLEFKTSIDTSSQADLESQKKFQRVIDKLQDKSQTTFAFVVHPENTPILEAERAVEELETVDVSTQLVIANQILPAEFCTTPYFKKRKKMQNQHLESMEDKFSAPVLKMPLFAEKIKGLDILIEAGKELYQE
jgi:arsenite-transporting ATPase